MAKQPLRIRIARAIAGRHNKDFIPTLTPDGLTLGSDTGRVKTYASKEEQLSANVGWCWTANNAIAEPFSAIPIKLFKKNGKGERDEIHEHDILNLIDSPNLALTGEQMRQLHATYMNFTGESYILMLDGPTPFEPGRGKLPDALNIFPAQKVRFELGDLYTDSTVKYANKEYPVTSFVRDINPDPANPYSGRSVVSAAALTLDLEDQMKRWNQGVFARGAHPSLIFKTAEAMDNESYERWKQQFDDEHTGTENAHRPLLIEGGDVVPYMLNAKDLDFLASRKFSKDEILAMWRVSPDILGYTENSNRATMDAAMYLHAIVNLVPRIRQFVRQLNATMVKPFDPMFELDFVNPVPEDVAAKIKYAESAAGRWLTINELRGIFGEDPLDKAVGDQIYMPGTMMSVQDIADGKPRPMTPAPQPADNKSHQGVKKNYLNQ